MNGILNLNRGLAILFLSLFPMLVKAEDLVLSSPDKRIKVEVLLHDKIYYRVSLDNEVVLQASPITLTVDNNKLGESPLLLGTKLGSVNQKIKTVWGSRNEIKDEYTELVLNFKGNYSLAFRAYDTGVAYRFITRINRKQVVVNDEEVAYRFNFGVSAWLLDTASYETNYRKEHLDIKEITDFRNIDRKLYLPAFVQATPKVKIAITEADLYDYPSLFLHRGNDYENYLLSRFEKYTLKTKPGGFSNYAEIPDEEAAFIARTDGNRSYPWRLLVISDKDATFADCDLVYQLARPNAMGDTGWIKPGKVAWDWWHDYIVEGTDFKGGVNTKTYFYQIDFAAKYKLDYIMVDWLWTDKYDLSLFNPEVDIKEIISYASQKGVKVILWCPGHSLYKQLNKSLELFSSLGAAGIKVDFFGREDQTGIRMYEEIAAAAARKKLLVDFHGCAKPTGLSRTYPNVINYEAVAGNEWNKLADKCTVNHKAMLPFTRGLQGPMDFTPGGMRNTVKEHAIFFTKPLVHGTRCNEMAVYVLYNEPLKMLCDAPSEYEREPHVIRFLSQIPTVWDDTKVLQAKFGEYLLEARRKDEVWYVAAITNENNRLLKMDFSFLGQGNYTAEIFTDGLNADRIGTDYKTLRQVLTSKSELELMLQPGGGAVMRIERLK